MIIEISTKSNLEKGDNKQSPVIIKTVEKPPVFSPVESNDKMRILLVVQGSANVIIDGESATLTADDVAVIPPRFILSHVNCDGFKYVEITLNILPSQESLGRYLHFINGNLGVPTFVKKDDYKHTDIYSAATKLTNSQEDVIENTESLLVTLFNHREKEAAKNMSKSKQRYAMQLILQRVSQITNTVVIDDIANACGYSEFYTMKLFKQYTGESIVDYANKYRVFVAYKMLLTTNKSVREIAHEVGFSNISYFNRQFKRMFNTTPSKAKLYS